MRIDTEKCFFHENVFATPLMIAGKVVKKSG